MIKKLIVCVSFVALLSTGINVTTYAAEKKKCFAWKVSDRSLKECFRPLIGGEAEDKEQGKKEKTTKSERKAEKERRRFC